MTRIFQCVNLATGNGYSSESSASRNHRPQSLPDLTNTNTTMFKTKKNNEKIMQECVRGGKSLIFRTARVKKSSSLMS